MFAILTFEIRHKSDCGKLLSISTSKYHKNQTMENLQKNLFVEIHHRAHRGIDWFTIAISSSNYLFTFYRQVVLRIESYTAYDWMIRDWNYI